MEWNFKLRNVPSDLQKRAKSEAALRGQTLNDFVIEAIRKAVEAESKPKPSPKK